MIGPLPARYRFVVVTVSFAVCLGLFLWLAAAHDFPPGGYVVGLLTGLVTAVLLVHDFSRPVAELPVDPT